MEGIGAEDFAKTGLHLARPLKLTSFVVGSGVSGDTRDSVASRTSIGIASTGTSASSTSGTHPRTSAHAGASGVVVCGVVGIARVVAVATSSAIHRWVVGVRIVLSTGSLAGFVLVVFVADNAADGKLSEVMDILKTQLGSPCYSSCTGARSASSVVFLVFVTREASGGSAFSIMTDVPASISANSGVVISASGVSVGLL